MHGLRSRRNTLLIAAWVLAFLGIGLRHLADHGADVPLPGEWVTEGAMLYRPWLHRAAGITAALSPADPGARLWKLAWLRWNGQWDPRLLALSALGLFAAAGGIFFAAVAAELSALGAFVLGVTAVSFLLFPGVLVHLLEPGQAWAGLLLVLSLIHLVGSVRLRPGGFGGFAAQLAGLLNVLTSTAGLASPLAVLGVIALGRRSGGEPAPRGLKAWNALLIIAGLARVVAFGGLARAGARAAAPAFGAWPLSFAGGALVVAAPAIALLAWTQVRASSSLALVRLLSVWALILAALLTANGILPPGVSPAAVLLFGLMVQCAALAAFPAGLRGRNARLLLGAAWLVLIGNGLFQQSRTLPGIDEEVAAVRARAAAVRRFITGGDEDALAPAIEGGGISAGAAADLLGDPCFREILPASIRPALPLTEATDETLTRSAPQSGFEPVTSAGDLEGKPTGLPAWSNAGAASRSRRALFVSAPIVTAAPMLQIYVAGRLDPPATSLVLRLADGREIAPLEPRVDATRRWKQLNFAIPRSGTRQRFGAVPRDIRRNAGAFRYEDIQIVARSSGGVALAFSAPLEAGRFSWLGRKAASAWPVLLGLALVLFSAAGAAAVLDRLRSGAPSSPAGGLARSAPWLAFFAYGLFLANFTDTVAAGADASGYLNSAKLLFHGRLTFPPREIAGVAVSLPLLSPLGLNTGPGGIVPGYPVGLPLLLAAAGRFLSLERAIPVVIMANLLLGVFFTRRLAEICGLSRGWAWIAAAAVAVCPLYVFMGLQPMSDGPSLVAVTAALYFALASRNRPGLAVAAGAAAAMAVLLRPANVICLAPVALALGLSPRRLAGCAAGGLPGAIFAAWYNHRLYGSALITGYGDVRSSFSSGWVGPTLRHYAVWLTALLTPVVWLSLLAPWLGRITRPARLALLAAVLGYLGFYAFYCFTHETWWYLRFVLPAFPCLAILALAVLRSLLERLRGARAGDPERRRIAIVAALLGLLAADLAWTYSRLPVLQSGRGNEVYRLSARWADDHLPAEAVILAYQTSGSLAYYTRHRIVRAEAVNTSEVARIVRQLAALRIPVYAMAFRFDSLPAFARLPGHWEKIAVLGETTLWRLAAPKA